ncbi:hypothetical protein HMF8227_01466 [Saliniradius amylolyticus]|uniref:Uncharacterized protein n=1 Tax=Saliniradius amylolyticus TaxID=2183582 RepID=A0A2S2E2S3_9ALTE|nr:hypothetical protein [Saliniradius amylolyticus]AWL11941.1 hypothetical protein HMF8227_01466 [Saliniradius amylolyticus]
MTKVYKYNYNKPHSGHGYIEPLVEDVPEGSEIAMRLSSPIDDDDVAYIEKTLDVSVVKVYSNECILMKR